VWKSDGTPAGTSPVTSFDNYYINPLFPVDDEVYFTVGQGDVWKTDGTEAGTIPLKVATTNSRSSFTKVGDVVYFSGRKTLYKTDGTAQGTTVVKKLGCNFSNGAPDPQFAVVGTTFYLRGDDCDHGYELWKSDGTEESTVLFDLLPGAGGSNPLQMRTVNDTLFFTAQFDQTRGRGLWALLPEPMAGDFDGDRDVDAADLLSWLENWTGTLDPGTGGKNPLTGDLDNDADVDSQDLVLLLTAWTGHQPAIRHDLMIMRPAPDPEEFGAEPLIASSASSDPTTLQLTDTIFEAFE
jgi:ELWxxDGT repeat protein